MNKEMNPVRISLENAEAIVHLFNVALNETEINPEHDDIHLFGDRAVSYERLIDMIREEEYPETHFDHDTVEYDRDNHEVILSFMDAVNIREMVRKVIEMTTGNNCARWWSADALKAWENLSRAMNERIIASGTDVFSTAEKQWNEWLNPTHKEVPSNVKEGEGNPEA